MTDSPAEIFAEPPVVESRDVVASLANSAAFGKQLATHAGSMGFAAALLKVFIADGSSTNWGIWQRHFKHWEFVPVLDFIHALTYVYSAAMAGRSRESGSPVYIRWITWVWQGAVPRVIAELAARVVELGPLPPDAADTDPRQIVAGTLTYLTNQQSRMNYPTYRKMGLLCGGSLNDRPFSASLRLRVSAFNHSRASPPRTPRSCRRPRMCPRRRRERSGRCLLRPRHRLQRAGSRDEHRRRTASRIDATAA